MTDQHPITPPPELVEQWHDDWLKAKVKHVNFDEYISNKAARWGADQELEACCEWLCTVDRWKTVAGHLRSTRRPKPPSLKEQAKFAAAVLRSPDETCSIAELQQHWHTICNALEALPDG